MKYLTLLFLLFNFTITSAQGNKIKFETFFKNSPDLKFNEENYIFELNSGLLTKYDVDLNEKLKYYVSYIDSSYTKGNQFYFVFYATDIEKIEQENKNRITDYELRIFVIMYDEKLGNILGIKIYNYIENNLEEEAIYLTKIGREKMKFNGE